MSRQNKEQAAKRGPPRLRRAYFESRHGQLHVHNAIPAGGGFNEGATLVCIHGDAQTGRVFTAALPALGATRSVYAPDLPGCGESDGAASALNMPSIEAAISGLSDFFDSMRFRQLDLLALGSGAAIARALAVRKPGLVRRVVLAGAPAATTAAGSPTQPLLELPATAVDDGAGLSRIAEFLA